jgi:hypothetical protein
MKKYIVILISTIVLSKTGFSQDATINAASDEAPAKFVAPVENIKKNELSVDLIPLIKWASMSQGVFDIKGTIQYKRQLKSHLFLRFGVTGIQERVEREYTDINVYPSIPGYKDMYYTGTKYKPQLHLNTGLEYRWGKRRIRQFAGVDLGYLHKERVYTNYSTTVPGNSNYDPNNYVGNQYILQDSSGVSYNNKTYVRTSYSQKSDGISITPFYGVQYHFSIRFFFSMQLGMPMQILWIRNKGITNAPFFYQNSQIMEYDLGDGGILNNFSLGFRF